jgi:CDP-glucose 4,6-dehydratase
MENMVNYQLLEKAYRGKKIFLTGHTGFKGAWLLKTLTLLGAEVKGYALEPNTPNDLFHLINGESLCNSVIADLSDKKRLEEEMISFQPDFVFHLAAQALVRLSYEIPAETFEVNVLGTANVLDCVKKLTLKCNVVLVTTDKVYQNNEWIFPYRENDRLGGFDPYSASKACAELLIDSYRNSFFNAKDYDLHKKAIGVVRAGNVIGGGDWSKDRLIPDIVRSLILNESINIRNPKSVRPWQHVLEPIVGYLILGMQLNDEPIKFSQAYNFGPEAQDALSVEQMLKLVIELWGSGTYRFENSINQPHEAALLKLDISKVADQLNWRPKMNAGEAVSFTLDWYKEFCKCKNEIPEFTTKQIKAYLNLYNEN